MGLFCLPVKALHECSAEDFVDAAEKNIALWKQDKSCTYLLDTFAREYLLLVEHRIAEDASEKQVVSRPSE